MEEWGAEHRLRTVVVVPDLLDDYLESQSFEAWEAEQTEDH